MEKISDELKKIADAHENNGDWVRANVARECQVIAQAIEVRQQMEAALQVTRAARLVA